ASTTPRGDSRCALTLWLTGTCTRDRTRSPRRTWRTDSSTKSTPRPPRELSRDSSKTALTTPDAQSPGDVPTSAFAVERGFSSPGTNCLRGMTVARGVLIVAVADETVELSPMDWVQAQTRKILETGTTEGIEGHCCIERSTHLIGSLRPSRSRALSGQMTGLL